MTVIELVAALGRAEVPIRERGGQLEVKDREGRFTPELRAAVRASRGELLALLTRRGVQCSRCGKYSFPEPTICFWCRRVPGHVAASAIADDPAPESTGEGAYAASATRRAIAPAMSVRLSS